MVHLPRRSRAFLVALVASLALATSAVAAPPSFIWKISGPNGAVYLVGSVHLLSPDYYPLAPALEAAYEDSDRLVEEVDLGELLSSSSQLALLSSGMLPADKTLSAVVSAKTLALVKNRAAAVGLPFAPLTRMKPWFLSMMLTALEWQKAGFDENLGLDKHFYDLATKDSKPVQGLETTADQIAAFDGMSAEAQEQLLVSSLEDLDSDLANINALTTAWKAGNAKEVERLALSDMQSDPVLYDRLLVARNQRWLPAIEALLTRPGRAFIVVGAAHLVGPDGLLKALEAKGYRVEQR
jgi:uncharacterized protein YbaP (TraB family)